MVQKHGTKYHYNPCNALAHQQTAAAASYRHHCVAAAPSKLVMHAVQHTDTSQAGTSKNKQTDANLPLHHPTTSWSLATRCRQLMLLHQKHRSAATSAEGAHPVRCLGGDDRAAPAGDPGACCCAGVPMLADWPAQVALVPCQVQLPSRPAT